MNARLLIALVLLAACFVGLVIVSIKRSRWNGEG